MTGAAGTVMGVTAADGAEAGPLPLALLAYTLHCTAWPLGRPSTVSGDAGPVLLPAPQFAV